MSNLFSLKRRAHKVSLHSSGMQLNSRKRGLSCAFVLVCALAKSVVLQSPFFGIGMKRSKKAMLIHKLDRDRETCFPWESTEPSCSEHLWWAWLFTAPAKQKTRDPLEFCLGISAPAEAQNKTQCLWWLCGECREAERSLKGPLLCISSHLEELCSACLHHFCLSLWESPDTKQPAKSDVLENKHRILFSSSTTLLRVKTQKNCQNINLDMPGLITFCSP